MEYHDPKKIPRAARSISLLANLFGRSRDLVQNARAKIMASDDAVPVTIERLYKRDSLSMTSFIFCQLRSLLSCRRDVNETTSRSRHGSRPICSSLIAWTRSPHYQSVWQHTTYLMLPILTTVNAFHHGRCLSQRPNAQPSFRYRLLPQGGHIRKRCLSAMSV